MIISPAFASPNSTVPSSRNRAIEKMKQWRASRNITEAPFRTRQRDQRVNDHFDRFTKTNRIRRTTVLDHLQELPMLLNQETISFQNRPKVQAFLNQTNNHEVILDWLAYHRVEQQLGTVDTGPFERNKRQLTTPDIIDDQTHVYNYEELELLEALTPLETRQVALRVAVSISKVKYLDYCNTGKITGRLLLYKCIQLFTLINRRKVGDLSKFGFSAAELAAMKV